MRGLCLSFPENSERLSHDHPTSLIRGKKTFVMYTDHEYPALWCVAPEGAQTCSSARRRSTTSSLRTSATAADWASASTGGIEWGELAAIVEDAQLEIAPKQLAEQALGGSGEPTPGERPRSPRLVVSDRFAGDAA